LKVIDVPTENIHIGDRHRRDMGDMEGLTANIREMGLLQPIGIDEFFNLVYGARRLEACADLGWKKIPCVVVKLKSILAGEWAENEMRKQFTPTEQKAIAKAVEDALLAEERRGRPAKNPPNLAELNRGKETRDIAAAKVGLKHSTYDKIQTVEDRGVPELVDAMDKGKIKIDAAAKIASQPKADQKRIVNMPKDEQREVVRQIRRTKADKEADERRARDVRLFMGLYHAVKLIGDFREEPKETWAGLWRVSAYDFADHLERALEYLPRLKKEHPNETKRPVKVS